MHNARNNAFIYSVFTVVTRFTVIRAHHSGFPWKIFIILGTQGNKGFGSCLTQK